MFGGNLNISYAKFYTSMLNDEWFVSLSCNARGLWMQLILIAKQVGDTGVVSMRSYSAMAAMCGCDDSSVAKYLRNFAEAQKITILSTGEKSLTIEIVNYTYYQRGDILNDSKNGEKSRVSKSKIGEKSPYNKTRQDKRRQDNMAHPLLTLFGELFLERFKTKYMANFQKDTVIAKKLYGELGEDETNRRLRRFFEDDDDFLRSAGHTVGVFKARINNYGEAVWAKRNIKTKDDWTVV